MIRFIDLGKQIGGDDEEWFRQFAFFNTISDRFLEYNHAQVWSNWEDFEKDYKLYPDGYTLERLKSLVPEWVPMKAK